MRLAIHALVGTLVVAGLACWGRLIYILSDLEDWQEAQEKVNGPPIEFVSIGYGVAGMALIMLAMYIHDRTKGY